MLRILTYHRIAEPESTPALDPRLISATPQVFERQMRHLRRHYRVIDVRTVLEAIERGNALPRRAVLLTFDDAYRDFATHAWPVLRHHGLSATLFVPTAYPDRPERCFWWDRLHRALSHGAQPRRLETRAGTLLLGAERDRRSGLDRLHSFVKATPHRKAMDAVDEICAALGEETCRDNGVLGWDELRRLASDGVSMGAHTRTHPILTRTGADEAREEIGASRSELRREIPEALPVFSYPDGGHDESIARIVAGEGFELAFTTLDGLNDLATHDPHRLCRTNVTRRTTPAVFRIRMLPPFARVDAWRHSGAGVHR